MRFVAFILESTKRIVLFLYGAFSGEKTYIPDINKLPQIEAVTVKFYANTPNTIIQFDSKDQTGYFRECRRHLKPRSFLRELFYDYCKYVYVNSHSRACLTILEAFIETPSKWKLFYKMGEGTARFSRITKFRNTGDYHLIGFEDGLPEWFYNQLLKLVQFAWGPIMEHRYCWCLHEGCPQTFNSSKSYVSKLIADFFGESCLIPQTYYAKLLFDGKIRVGVVVEPAYGEDPSILTHKLSIEEVSPILQKNLISLWIIDQICYQKDHRPGNYFIGKNQDSHYSFVSAFDNDCPTTLFPTKSISFSTYIGVPPMFERNGDIRIPYISRRLYEAFKEMDNRNLRERILNYCSRLEASMLMHRTRKIRCNLLRNVSLGHLSILIDEDWSTKTMRDEMRVSSDTYFSYFVRHYVDWELGFSCVD